jgi:hypothetical protein
MVVALSHVPAQACHGLKPRPSLLRVLSYPVAATYKNMEQKQGKVPE